MGGFEALMVSTQDPHPEQNGLLEFWFLDDAN
jgi:hypothetical protein